MGSKTLQPEFEMHVLSGNHKGVRRELCQGEITVGSSFQADLILTDLSLEGLQARINMTSDVVEIETPGTGNMDVDFDGVKRGEKVTRHYPALIEIGDVFIEIKRLKPRLSEKIIENRKPLLVTLGIFAASVIALTSSQMRQAGNARIEGDRANRLLEAGLDKQRLAKLSSDTAINRAQMQKEAASALDALKGRLAALNITDLQVSSQLGMITVFGTVDPANKETWTATQQWFDQNYGSKVMMQANVSFTPRKNMAAPIIVQSIWAGTIPYFIDSKGDKYFEGSMLKDGWNVEKIEDGKVVLQKQNEKLVLKV